MIPGFAKSGITLSASFASILQKTFNGDRSTFPYPSQASTEYGKLAGGVFMALSHFKSAAFFAN